MSTFYDSWWGWFLTGLLVLGLLAIVVTRLVMDARARRARETDRLIDAIKERRE